MTPSNRGAARRRPGRSQRPAPRHVAPVLDPNWRNPYEPSADEREANRRAIFTWGWRHSRTWLVVAAAVVVLGVVGAIAMWWLALVGVVIGVAVAAFAVLQVRSLSDSVTNLADEILSSFTVSNDEVTSARLRTILDRLSGTFGLDGIEFVVVRDDGYNATLLPVEDGLTLLVTDALVRDFELIEVEGVIAHLMARQRLGSLERRCAAAQVRWPETQRRALAGVDAAHRADEVAAAAIRYPLGIAQALERCVRRGAPAGSYFATSRYDATRWVWFDLYADRAPHDEGDLDGAPVRNRALAEW